MIDEYPTGFEIGPKQGLVMGEKLLWKYEENRHATKPTRFEFFIEQKYRFFQMIQSYLNNT